MQNTVFSRSLSGSLESFSREAILPDGRPWSSVVRYISFNLNEHSNWVVKISSSYRNIKFFELDAQETALANSLMNSLSCVYGSPRQMGFYFWLVISNRVKEFINAYEGAIENAA
jgi:hypothetical protein